MAAFAEPRRAPEPVVCRPSSVVVKMTSVRSLPNFIVIGAMKAGTGSAYQYLRGHPQVFMSDPKELDFFVAEKTWGRGLGWYESHFANAQSCAAIGEASPNYSRAPTYQGVPERMHRIIPAARLIYFVRDPVDRIQSHYLHELRKRTERRAPDKAVSEDPMYLAPSRYADQIDRYLEWFPREQLKVIVSEDLRFRRRETLRSLFEFLGVDPAVVPSAVGTEFHRSGDWRSTRPGRRGLRSSPVGARLARRAPQALLRVGRITTQASDDRTNQMSTSTRSELAARLAPDVARLRQFLGPDFDGWGIA